MIDDFWFVMMNIGYQYYIVMGDKNLCVKIEYYCIVYWKFVCQWQGVVDIVVIYSFEIGFSNFLIFWCKY